MLRETTNCGNISKSTNFYYLPTNMFQMSAPEGIRMRQTCSSINKLVEDAKISFPSLFVLVVYYYGNDDNIVSEINENLLLLFRSFLDTKYFDLGTDICASDLHITN